MQVHPARSSALAVLKTSNPEAGKSQQGLMPAARVSAKCTKHPLKLVQPPKPGQILRIPAAVLLDVARRFPGAMGGIVHRLKEAVLTHWQGVACWETELQCKVSEVLLGFRRL